MREIYLDNNATTKTAPEVIEAMVPYFSTYFGNPSSLHKKGIEAERAVKNAREQLAGILHVKTSEIFFTSGATESDNWALIGTAQAMKRKGSHIITTKIEHDAVLKACKHLENNGFEITYLDVDEFGNINPDDLFAAVKDTTTLVSIMHVNNEIGTAFPINDLAGIVKKKNSNTVFFSDGAQALGKTHIDISNIDLYSLSSHKIHGPKGVGLLVVKDGIKISPLMFGGGQEKGLRPGTENVASVVGFAKAGEMAIKNLNDNINHFKKLRDVFLSKIKEFEDIRINSPENGMPSTLNIGFKGIPSEVLLHALEEEGVYVSSGSACSTGKKKISHVISAIGVPDEYAESSLRFGLSRYTTKEEIVFTCKALGRKLKELRNNT